MQLTTHTDYALRLLIYLAVNEENKATIQDAAVRFSVSAHHLAKVAQTLVQYHYVISHRGRGGGLKLAEAPENIRIGSVVKKTENLELLPCFGDNSACPIKTACTLKSALAKAQQAFLDVLDEYTLADLILNKAELQSLLKVA